MKSLAAVLLLSALPLGAQPIAIGGRAPGPGGVALPTAKPPLRLAGRVIDLESRKPLAGALVWPAGNPASPVRTGEDGRYEIVVSPAADLRLQASAPGYFPSAPLAVLSAPASSSARPGPTLPLAPTAALGGTVIDSTGQPVQGAEIASFRSREGRPLPGDPKTRSTATGAFRLEPLAPREIYSLRVEKTGFAPATLTVEAPRPLATRGDLKIVLTRGLVAHGQVTDGAGKPLSGALATLSPSASAAGELGVPDRLPPAKARSDAKGRFEVPGLSGGVFDLAVGARGFGSVLVRGIMVGQGREDLGTVILPPGTGLEGIVIDPDGQPISGAKVSVSSSPSEDLETGADGRFTLTGLKDGEIVTVRVTRTGYLPSPAVTSEIRVPTADPVRVVLHPGSRVLGRVSEETGEAVPGARVLLTPQTPGAQGPVASARTDADGRFLMEGVEPGRGELRVTAPGLLAVAAQKVEVPAGEDLEGLEVTLSRGATVEGRVTTADGDPAAGAQVQVVERPESAPLPAYATTAATTTADGDGAYRLTGIAEGRRFVAAAHPGQPGTVKTVEVRTGTNHLDLRLPTGHDVTGRVVDTAGNPLGEAHLTLTSRTASRDAESLADGSFQLTGVPDGAYQLAAAKEGYSPLGDASRVQVSGAAVTGLELRLQRGGTIAGTLRGLDAAALAGVELWASGPAGGRAGLADPTGAYRIENVPPGNWTVQAQVAATGRQARGTVTLSPGQDQALLDLDLGAGLTLTGRILKFGIPVAGAGVTLKGAPPLPSAGAVADPQGRFRLESLTPGKYELLIPLPGGGLHRQVVELAADQDLAIELGR
ncbi:MAG TPA: carboxypeptidase regulatory-like domain-containing protein [Thermoanaerobaculia bacterium]|nr:carboxypeptidase regulatory-like domain-containing protein [Thermoanaerobaculia bacterium]